VCNRCAAYRGARGPGLRAPRRGGRQKPTPASQGVTPVPQPVRRACLGEGSGFRPGDDDAPARRGAPARRLARHL